MSGDKKKKGISDKLWASIQMTLTLKDNEHPFYKMTLTDYLSIKRRFKEEALSYVCATCITSRVLQNMNGLRDANTGEVIDTDGSGDYFCDECDAGNEEQDKNIIDADILLDFTKKYGV